MQPVRLAIKIALAVTLPIWLLPALIGTIAGRIFRLISAEVDWLADDWSEKRQLKRAIREQQERERSIR
jgi:hypothetical protein